MDQELIAFLTERFRETSQQIEGLREETAQQFAGAREETAQQFAQVDRRVERVEHELHRTRIVVESLRGETRDIMDVIREKYGIRE
jgi:ABC-type phosphate transport system auxiliary subunit